MPLIMTKETRVLQYCPQGCGTACLVWPAVCPACGLPMLRTAAMSAPEVKAPVITNAEQKAELEEWEARHPK